MTHTKQNNLDLKSNPPIVSVIIVNFNGKKWLNKCISSLFRQTYQHIEVILVDNGSTDGSADYVSNKFPSVKVFLKQNEGYGSACNFGAHKSTGKFLMFFNEDMYVENNFIKNFINYYETIDDKSTFGTIGCRIDNYDKTRYYSFKQYGYVVDLLAQPSPNKNPNRIFHNSGCPLFILKSTFIKIKGFCPNIFLYSEDIDLCWRLNLFGYKHYFLEREAIYHKGGGVVGQFSPKKITYYFTGDLNTILNNYSSISLLIILPMFIMYYLLIILFFALTLKTDYITSLFKAVHHFLNNSLKDTLVFRSFVQHNRVVSDRSIISKMSLVPSRIINIFMK